LTKILSFCEDKIPSVVLGVNNILEYISNKIDIEFSFKKTYEVKSRDVIQSDIIICVRGASDSDKNIINLAKLYNCLIIYYLDDDLFNVPKYASCSPFYESKHIRENMVEIMEKCDILWTSNYNIEKKYSSYFSRRYVIDIPITIEKVNDKNFKKEESNNGLVKICFAGSIDHVYMFDEILAPVINNISEKYKNKVEICIIGINPKRLKKSSNIKIIEFFDDITDYYNFIKENKFDIGLAPLKKTDFNSCKYYNKFLDYTSKGMVGVYSNVDPYKIVVKNEINGMLTENKVVLWQETLEKLILSEKLRYKIYDNAVKYIQEKFSYEYITLKILESIPEIKNRVKEKVKKRNRYLEKKIDLNENFLITRIINGFKIFGIKYFWIGGKKVPRKTLNYLKRKLKYENKKI
jgi:glycosyltransferase